MLKPELILIFMQPFRVNNELTISSITSTESILDRSKTDHYFSFVICIHFVVNLQILLWCPKKLPIANKQCNNSCYEIFIWTPKYRLNQCFFSRSPYDTNDPKLVRFFVALRAK